RRSIIVAWCLFVIRPHLLRFFAEPAVREGWGDEPRDEAGQVVGRRRRDGAAALLPGRGPVAGPEARDGLGRGHVPLRPRLATAALLLPARRESGAAAPAGGRPRLAPRVAGPGPAVPGRRGAADDGPATLGGAVPGPGLAALRPPGQRLPVLAPE